MRQLCNVSYVAQAEAALSSEDESAFTKFEAELNRLPPGVVARAGAGGPRLRSNVTSQLLELMARPGAA